MVIKPTGATNHTISSSYVTLNCSWDEYGFKTGSCPSNGKVPGVPYMLLYIHVEDL